MREEKTRIYLLRHGETVNTKGEFRYNGHYDVDITRTGEEQLALQAQKLKERPIRKVYSSGLLRSVKGARTLAAAVDAEL
ncbi:MAG: histidine phosphatase family protein, partial [Nitrospirota bacterium]|nr:histidine phosphatase family protein [Nitrospirota bacterium]